MTDDLLHTEPHAETDRDLDPDRRSALRAFNRFELKYVADQEIGGALRAELSRPLDDDPNSRARSYTVGSRLASEAFRERYFESYWSLYAKLYASGRALEELARLERLVLSAGATDESTIRAEANALRTTIKAGTLALRSHA